MFSLVLISIPFYTLQLVDPFGLFNLLKPVESFFGIEKFAGSSSAITSKYYVNVFFYSLNIIYVDLFHRSAGFAFEPGFYSIFLCIALFFNIKINNSINNLKSYFFIGATISTFSTTGFICLFFILTYNLLQNKNDISKLVIFPVFLFLISFSFFQIDFLYDKIKDSVSGTGSMTFEEIGRNQSFTAGRILGFRVALKNVEQNPFFGFGDHAEEEYFRKKLNSRVGIINGWGNLLATLGIIGFFIFIICLIRFRIFLIKFYILVFICF